MSRWLALAVLLAGCAVPLGDYATARPKRCGCLESCSCSDCCGPEDCKCPKPNPSLAPEAFADGTPTNAAILRGSYR